MKPRHALLFLALLAPAVPDVASGQPKPPPKGQGSSAADLKRAGDDAMGTLRYEDALRSYAAAYAMNQDPALLYNQGRAYQALGQYAEALGMFQSFQQKAPPELMAKVPKLGELMADVAGRVSRVSFTSNAPQTRVLVRKQVVGSAPITVQLNAGPASIDAQADGYKPLHLEVTLPSAGSLPVELKLERIDPRGTLVIKSDPTGATVTLNGKPVGETPYETALDPGPVSLLLQHDGYQPLDSSALVETGGRKELVLTLDKTPSVLSRWWFWTAVGAVVVGGAVLSVALLTDRKPSTGDVQPGQVSAPLRLHF